MIDMTEMFRLYDKKPRVVDSEDAVDLVLNPDENGPTIRFEDVSFEYAPGQPVFSGLNLEVSNYSAHLKNNPPRRFSSKLNTKLTSLTTMHCYSTDSSREDPGSGGQIRLW